MVSSKIIARSFLQNAFFCQVFGEPTTPASEIRGHGLHSLVCQVHSGLLMRHEVRDADLYLNIPPVYGETLPEQRDVRWLFHPLH